MQSLKILRASLGLVLLACSESADDVAGTAGAAGEASIESGGSAGDVPLNSGAGGGSAEGGAPGASTGGARSHDAGEGGAEAAAMAGATGNAGAPPAFSCEGEGARFVTAVVDVEFGEGQDFGQDRFPDVIYGRPLGDGCCSGSLDVVSLGEGGFVVVEFEGNVITDGEGPDFIVFENAFVPEGAEASAVFAEVGSVSVSQDGVRWYEYPCTADEYPFGDCAGWHAVLTHPDENDISPFDPDAAGGDSFDLADVGIAWARYVRIEDRADVEGTFDLDAVAIVNAGCE